MKKSYSFLEKKLQEIEQAHAQNEDIQQKIEFLKTIISAEVSPHPSDSIPRPLLSISEQLAQVESGYLKRKGYGTASPGSCFSDYDKCDDDQEDKNDPMPELETVKASPVIAKRTVEKSRGLKGCCCWCLVMMMGHALFFVIGATLMLSFCGCSGYYYRNDNIRLQYAQGFMTPT